MATLVVLTPKGYRVVVKTTPNMQLLHVLEEACRHPAHNYDPTAFQLRCGKKGLDLSLPLRFAGLANHATVDLVAADTTRKGERRRGIGMLGLILVVAGVVCMRERNMLTRVVTPYV